MTSIVSVICPGCPVDGATRLLGYIVFGVPAWLCAALPVWIVQAILVILAIRWLLSDPKAVKTAIANLNTFVDSVTANTNERPGLAQIQAKIQGEALALSLEELRILRERVATARDAEANNVRKGIYGAMVEELDRIIAERTASGGA